MNTEQSLSATDAALWQLWTLLLNALLNYFATTPQERLRASYLDVTRKFLADSGVTVKGDSPADMQRELERLRAISLPFSE